jgi:hypothetical protein
MKLFNKINGGAKLFTKMNDQSNVFSKYSQRPSLSNAVAKVGHFIANKNNHLERSVKHSSKDEGPNYK